MDIVVEVRISVIKGLIVNTPDAYVTYEGKTDVIRNPIGV